MLKLWVKRLIGNRGLFESATDSGACQSRRIQGADKGAGSPLAGLVETLNSRDEARAAYRARSQQPNISTPPFPGTKL